MAHTRRASPQLARAAPRPGRRARGRRAQDMSARPAGLAGGVEGARRGWVGGWLRGPGGRAAAGSEREEMPGRRRTAAARDCVPAPHTWKMGTRRLAFPTSASGQVPGRGRRASSSARRPGRPARGPAVAGGGSGRGGAGAGPVAGAGPAGPGPPLRPGPPGRVPPRPAPRPLKGPAAPRACTSPPRHVRAPLGPPVTAAGRGGGGGWQASSGGDVVPAWRRDSSVRGAFQLAGLQARGGAGWLGFNARVCAPVRVKG